MPKEKEKKRVKYPNLYKYEIGKSKEDLDRVLKHLEQINFQHIRYNSIKNQYEARKRIENDRECHVIIRKIKGGKYRAYLHIDIVVSDVPLQHRMLRDPVATERWGKKIFKEVIR